MNTVYGFVCPQGHLLWMSMAEYLIVKTKVKRITKMFVFAKLHQEMTAEFGKTVFEVKLVAPKEALT